MESCTLFSPPGKSATFIWASWFFLQYNIICKNVLKSATFKIATCKLQEWGRLVLSWHNDAWSHTLQINKQTYLRKAHEKYAIAGKKLDKITGYHFIDHQNKRSNGMETCEGKRDIQGSTCWICYCDWCTFYTRKNTRVIKGIILIAAKSEYSGYCGRDQYNAAGIMLMWRRL